jgi:hypothetical protein
MSTKDVFILCAVAYAGLALYGLTLDAPPQTPGNTPATPANVTETAPRIVQTRVPSHIDKTVLVGDCAQIYNWNAGIYADNKCDYPINLIFCNVRAFETCAKGNFVTYNKSLLPGHHVRVSLARRSQSDLRIEACYIPYRPWIEYSQEKGENIVVCRPPTPMPIPYSN